MELDALIAAIAATTITVVSAENPQRYEYESQVYHVDGSKKRYEANTVDIRIRQGERRQREAALMTDELTALSGRVQLRLEAKFGGPAEALKHPDAINMNAISTRPNSARNIMTRIPKPT